LQLTINPTACGRFASTPAREIPLLAQDH